MPDMPVGAAGPDEQLRRKQQYLIPCVYQFYRNPPHIVAADGCWLYDHTGRRYLDCYCGVTVMNAGHGNPAIIEPAIGQIRTLQHTTSIYLTEPILRLAERLARLVPRPLKRSFFCASGSEAVEGALLLAALHTKRPEIVAMRNGLHGRTRWAMNATGLDMWRTDPFPQAEVHHVPFGDVSALSSLLAARGDRIAAVVGEPIQGNGGINVPPDDYWPAVRDVCTRHGALLVLDEVQTGFGRTGRWFACQRWGIVPDVLVLSKALGNGFPIAAFVTSDAIAASYTRPGASTHGGNPVAATAALATLRFHEAQRLAERADRLGTQFLEGLIALAVRHRCFGTPRGKGLMIGVDVLDEGGQPDSARLDRLLESLKDRGFLCGKTGAGRNVLTFMPPLVIEPGQLDTVLEALDAAVRESENTA